MLNAHKILKTGIFASGSRMKIKRLDSLNKHVIENEDALPLAV